MVKDCEGDREIQRVRDESERGVSERGDIVREISRDVLLKNLLARGVS